MSLIMDALKKAQQTRPKESQRTPFSKNLSPQYKKSLKSFGKRWIIIGPVLACLVIAVFFFLKPTSPTLNTKPVGSVTLIEKKNPLQAIEEIPQDSAKEMASPELIETPQVILTPFKETLSPNSIEGPKDILNQPGETLSTELIERPKGQLSAFQKEKVTSGREAPLKDQNVKDQRGESLKKQVGQEKKVKKVYTDGKIISAAKKVSENEKNLVKNDFNTTHLDSLKEEALSKPPGIAIEEKDHPVISEAIHYFNLGVSSYNEREALKAIQAYQKATELNPDYVEAYNNLGIIYQELGDLDKAFEAFQKAVGINPQYEKAYNNLGILLLSKDRFEEAAEAFQKALAINPNNDESLINLGVLFTRIGQLEKGIEAYQKALAINPHRGETHYNIGLLYEEMGKVDLAVDHYQTFIQLSLKTNPVLVSKVKSHLNYLLKVKNNQEDSRG
jgi:type IV pilus biogenesis/stability protein PilW